MPLCPRQTLLRQGVPQPARLDQHWGKTELLGSLGTPHRAGVHPEAPWAQLKGGTWLHTTSIPQRSHPSTTQPAPLQGKPRCLEPQSPPGLPLILALQTFPGLGKPLNQALAGSMCCSLAVAGARGSELHHLLRAEAIVARG